MKFQNFNQFKKGLEVLNEFLKENNINMECIAIGGLTIAYWINKNNLVDSDLRIRDYLESRNEIVNDDVYECRPTDDMDFLLTNPEITDKLIEKKFVPGIGGLRSEISSENNTITIDILHEITNTGLWDFYYNEFQKFPKIFNTKNLTVYMPPRGEVYADKCSLAREGNKHEFDKSLLESILSEKMIRTSKRIHKLEN